jgi:hypothetical protein
MELLGYYCDAIKSDDNGMVSGYLVRYGSPNETDLEGDYFTKDTDFGFPTDTKVPLNLYYHHGMDKTIGKRPVGKGYVMADDKGLWYQAQLEMSDEYGKMIADLAKKGRLGYSSGAASHMVERKTFGNVSEITRWPIAEASLTPTPAEPKNTVKSIESLITEPEVKMDSYGESGDSEAEIEIPPAVGNPSEWAMSVYDGAKEYLFHEGIEHLYEIMCQSLYTIGEQPGPLTDYVAAIVDEFGKRVKELSANVDDKTVMKAVRHNMPETVRLTEHRLRDAFGVSRSTAKRLAPMVYDSLRDAEPEAKSVDVLGPETEPDHVERAQLQIVLRERITR